MLPIVRIHDLDSGESRLVDSIESCRGQHEQSIYQECLKRDDVITMGTTVAQPLRTIPNDMELIEYSRKRIEDLENQTQLIREMMGWCYRGEIISKCEDLECQIILVADGLGRSSLMRVEGNYPVDFITKECTEYDSEAEGEAEFECLFARINGEDI